ncbi:ABC transporter ATP-binding protein [Roseibium marinum]|uniref:NitT/TauT family transport system ATP-binding protein n=1 Tax=Roseibium marinum TaxID=281252 RepID=A0A2S3UJZ1_9HYPH|nr:ATP-binding cassette domain-containing protein [Roseibium marinum]POF27981.1 NitT/TauT family transport system ATP-binding protein [Roseibium marinum]
MISVDIKTKNYGQTRVLKDVSFELQRGQCLAVLGKSGIGKSTLLRLVAGIDHDFEGTVRRPEAMAIVFQEPTLLLWRRAIDNLLIIHPQLSEAAARDMLAKVGLGDKADMYPKQLSLGQQRRLSLARAFAGHPELLILDEPFVSLDEATAADMIALTQTLMRELTPATLFVTHEKEEARQLADRTLELAGSPATVVPDCKITEFRREEAS